VIFTWAWPRLILAPEPSSSVICSAVTLMPSRVRCTSFGVRLATPAMTRSPCAGNCSSCPLNTTLASVVPLPSFWTAPPVAKLACDPSDHAGGDQVVCWYFPTSVLTGSLASIWDHRRPMHDVERP
jgi:hypothetical protein